MRKAVGWISEMLSVLQLNTSKTNLMTFGGK